MKRFILLFGLSFFFALCCKAQQEAVRAFVFDNDTIASIQLPEVWVGNKPRSNRQQARQAKRHARTVHNVRKALPYAKIAAQKIEEIETRLARIPASKDKKELVNAEYKELMKTFKQPLMQLTVTQGRILVRLIYRETRKSSFQHIREYKGGVNATFWQTLALLFGNNLKAEYDPEGDDLEIEMIVRDIEAGRL